ncbi:hypothetical protein K458DRAFT_338676 [Lentithecium fluviatile CBS 122367]|uniref:Sequence orphan n=1 Tax=Lentithecium fluviatile CBS 122367 TaxID=1168545 RepID=A0A6G1J1X7_9PLEO|nr:hypothetical protein K458DRAFT_338676 [Lentithecium fluviatile CBS 122367]
MGEERAGGKPLSADAIQHKSFHSHSTIQSTAEPGDVSWSAPPLPKPKLPSAISSLPKPSMPATTAIASKDEAEVKTWNTRNLGLRVSADAVAAASAGVLVAPVITMIDKGIIENASGRNTLGESLKKSARELLLRPHRFLGSKPFALIFALYFGTYFTANSIDTASSTLQNTPVPSTTAGTSKFVATSTANLALCLYKDNRFTQLFGSAASSRPVPLPTFALFTVRDCLTIFASFNLPSLLAPKLEARMSEEVKKFVGAATVAQFVTPAAVQIVSTPLHLLGLDLYNRQGVHILGQDGRAGRVVRDWAKSSFARMGRIIPAFGIGGVVNTKVRRGLMERLE